MCACATNAFVHHLIDVTSIMCRLDGNMRNRYTNLCTPRCWFKQFTINIFVYMDVQRQGVDWWSHTKMCSISQRTRPTTHIHIYMSSIYIYFTRNSTHWHVPTTHIEKVSNWMKKKKIKNHNKLTTDVLFYTFFFFAAWKLVEKCWSLILKRRGVLSLCMRTNAHIHACILLFVT